MTDAKSLDVLVNEYKTTAHLSERARADLERRIWNHCPRTGIPNGRRIALQDRLGVSHHHGDARFYLLNAAQLAEPIWERIEAGMPTATGARLLKKSRETAEQMKTTPAAALAVVLADFDKLPLVRVANGRAYRRRPALAPSRLSAEPPSAVSSSPWHTLENEAKRLLGPKFLEIRDPDDRERNWLSFQTELRVLMSDYQARLAVRAKPKRQAISRDLVVSACEALHMEPPPPGAPLDLDYARKQKRKLAKLYHPDMRGGRHDTQAVLGTVLRAFETVERYQAERRAL